MNSLYVLFIVYAQNRTPFLLHSAMNVGQHIDKYSIRQEGFDLRFTYDNLEEARELTQIQTQFVKYTILQQLTSNISILEKEKLLNSITDDTPFVNILNGGLLDDWEYPRF